MNAFLQMQAISKAFPGVQALRQVSFDLRRGEVHALVGENGAGKSTLMKILSGVYRPDAGQILIEGQPVTIQIPRDAQRHGISIVHQELNLFSNLTVAENVFGGRMPARGPLAFEDRQAAARQAQRLLDRFGVAISPQTIIRSLSLAQQQVVEISKALIQEARVLILDEPTSSLTEHEAAALFEVVQQLRRDGLCIVYISHRLEEVFRIADRVTILRDGQLVGTEAVAETSIPAVIRMMVGRQLADLYGQRAGQPQAVVLTVEALTSPGHFAEVSFQLRAGEIVGMAGLVGAGRTEVGLALFGALPVSGGRVQLRGAGRQIRSPDEAMRWGLAYLSEDRRNDALFFNMGVRENISVSHLARLSRLGLIDRRRERQATQFHIEQLKIATPSTEQKVANLSGGNQQKVILARWLAIEPKVLIVDEPTRGIDVGAKTEIYALLHHLAAQGVAILLISSEMPEILGLSDRILVMHEGRLAGELTRAEATEERILTLAAGRSAIPAG
ncbi:MAG: sugar ABC transporter ATP-binding protein [Anaerolineales bacterium]|nr:sugar ABC transporter ATP-binding protein [Anaerolineales bacterium]